MDTTRLTGLVHKIVRQMPTHEFVCDFCANRRYIEISITAEIKTPTCEYCGLLMSRVWSAAPVHFKGDGFYSTGG